MASSLVLVRDWTRLQVAPVERIRVVRAGIQTLVEAVVESTDLKGVAGRAVAAVARMGSAEERFAVVEGTRSPEIVKEVPVTGQVHEKTVDYPQASQTVR
jgi:hypothetical protein